VGNRGIHLWRRYNYNDIVPSAREAVALARVEDDPDLDALIDASRRLPGIGDVITDDDSGISTYNSLQVWANRRFSRGLAFSLAYTWSHAITDVPLQAFTDTGATDPFNFKLDRGNADLDRRQMFIATVVYEMPSIKRWGGLANSILGNWQVNVIATFLSGAPIDIQTGESTAAWSGRVIRQSGPTWSSEYLFTWTVQTRYSFSTRRRSLFLRPEGLVLWVEVESSARKARTGTSQLIRTGDSASG